MPPRDFQLVWGRYVTRSPWAYAKLKCKRLSLANRLRTGTSTPRTHMITAPSLYYNIRSIFENDGGCLSVCVSGGGKRLTVAVRRLPSSSVQHGSRGSADRCGITPWRSFFHCALCPLVIFVRFALLVRRLLKVAARRRSLPLLLPRRGGGREGPGFRSRSRFGYSLTRESETVSLIFGWAIVCYF